MQKVIRLGPLETKLFSWAQNRGVTLVRTGDLKKFLNFKKRQEEILLSNMSRSGLIIQIMRGLYLLPKNIPSGGIWKPSIYRLIDIYMKELKVTKYQITGLTEFNYYSLSTQIPNLASIYNDKVSITKNIAGQRLQFIKTAKKRLINIKEIKIKESEINTKTYMGTFPKTVFDAIYDYKKFGTLPEAYEWLQQIALKKEYLNEYLEIILKIGNIATLRRSGFVLEKLGTSNFYLKKIENCINRTISYIPLNPINVKKGFLNKRWGLIINDEIIPR